jgi:hypothetical protein
VGASNIQRHVLSKGIALYVVGRSARGTSPLLGFSEIDLENFNFVSFH